MTDDSVPKLSKTPFLIGDAIVCLAAAATLYYSLPPQGVWGTVLCVGALAAAGWGAWLGILPFLTEFRAASRQSETENLEQSLSRIQNIEAVSHQIQEATGRWQTVQESSAKTVATANEIAERMNVEAKEFFRFLDKANDQEKNHLRLEAEKLRRTESEWVEITVRMLDHIFALNVAAGRSGQPNLISQLGQFQAACRDLVRRVGLVAHVPKLEEPYDPKAHHVLDENKAPAAGTPIREVLAPGFSYQGHLIRKPLVVAGTANPEPAEALDSPEPNQAS